eukprot:TRINITY_DN69509_c0_g1_i1.p1 TRINITY_DN69509_c0_g1~~TRINITY_DN69509_c0_g1_i1.p1  ORF type:complete len:293 (+),score=32.89 TRINITY_DN69509_c0_g1_i1:72-881(+)
MLTEIRRGGVSRAPADAIDRPRPRSSQEDGADGNVAVQHGGCNVADACGVGTTGFDDRAVAALGLEVPLGRSLREDREDGERHRTVPRGFQSSRTACTAKAGSQLRNGRIGGTGLVGVSASQISPRLGPVGGSDASGKGALVVHRHHHHHYHHHYLLDANADIKADKGQHANLNESSSAATHEEAKSARLDTRWATAVPAHQIGRAEHQHLHYHHHTGEDGPPPRAQRLLEEARLANAQRTVLGGYGSGGAAGSGRCTSGLDTRLPRLA